MEEVPDVGGRRECLILGNGPSLRGRNWTEVPRDRVFVIGLNQSWRETQDVDAHMAIDHDQFSLEAGELDRFPGGAIPYYSAMAKRRCLYHLSSSPTIPSGKRRAFLEGGRALHRHDALTFSRHPFRKRHQGEQLPKPPLAEDGGIALAVKNETRGSVAYLALQIAAALPFETIWLVGLDMTDEKFEGAFGYDSFGRHKKPTFHGAKSASTMQDRLWRWVPEDVRSRVRVIEPSRTQVLQVVSWPWGGRGRDN